MSVVLVFPGSDDTIAEFTQRVPQFLDRAALRYQFRVNSQMVFAPSGLPSCQESFLAIYV